MQHNPSLKGYEHQKERLAKATLDNRRKALKTSKNDPKYVPYEEVKAFVDYTDDLLHHIGTQVRQREPFWWPRITYLDDFFGPNKRTGFQEHMSGERPLMNHRKEKTRSQKIADWAFDEAGPWITLGFIIVSITIIILGII